MFYDRAVSWRARHQPAPDSHIVICGMTEEDLVKYGHPLDDAKLATLLETITDAGPCVVGVDLFRDLPEPRSGEFYPKLEQILRTRENIIAIERIPDIKPPPALVDQPDRFAPNNLSSDKQFDGICRGATLFFEGGMAEPRESFALALTHFYLDAHRVEASMVDVPWSSSSLLRLGRTIFPRLTPNAGAYSGLTIQDYEILIDYRAPQHLEFGPGRSDLKYRAVTFGDILEKRLPAGTLKDAIVIVGVTTPTVKDSIATPVNDHLRGAEIHAVIVNQLLRAALDGEPPTSWWPEPATIAWIGLCTFLGGALGLVLRSPWKLAPGLALLLGAILFAGWEALLHALWIPTTTPALGAFAAATFVTSLVVFLEHSERRVMRTLFSRHVSKEVLDLLWAERDQLLDGGRLKPQRVVATVLFTDLKDYTMIAEEMDPPELMNWVNEYMNRIAPLVEVHGGFVNAYGGDAIMAVFGAPVPHTSEPDIDRDATRAVECALAMREALKALNAGWAERAMPTVSMRVGIYTGPVVTGQIGSIERMEYTALGDTTNTAARLQTLGRERPYDETTAPCTILIGDSTWQRLQGRFTATLVGSMRLKGKSREVIVHSILSATQSTSPV